MNKVKIDKFVSQLIYKVFFITIIISIFFNTKLSVALENRILIKLNNEIVTTVDIAQEINYLKSFNKKILELDNEKIISIAKNSIVKEKIKKIEILKYTQNLTIDEKYLSSMIEGAYSKIGLNNIDQFKNYLDDNDVNIKMVEEKLIIDAYWTQIIYNKYKDKIKIDKNKIISEISSRKNKFYNISEIMFNVEKSENLNEKYKLIKQSINDNGFENTALIYSISESSKNGGDVGWINESAISPKIETELYSIKKGEYTRPITIPGGFLILKVNDVKEENVKIDINKEIEKVIDIKTNEQLNQFSNLYMNKIKKNINIHEL